METESTPICIPNIDAAGRRQRRRSGAVMLAFTVLLLAVLVAAPLSPWWRLLLFPFFTWAAVGFFQARERT